MTTTECEYERTSELEMNRTMDRMEQSLIENNREQWNREQTN